MNRTSYRRLAVLLAAAGLVTACSGKVGTQPAEECAEGLRIATEELEDAKLKGFSSTVAWAKAASLLSAASVQKQFEKYPNCIDKVRRARAYIRESQR